MPPPNTMRGILARMPVITNHYFKIYVAICIIICYMIIIVFKRVDKANGGFVMQSEALAEPLVVPA